MDKKIRTLSLAVTAVLAVSAVQARADMLTTPLGSSAGHLVSNAADIENFYNGGSDSVPANGTGPNLGVTFSNNAEGLVAGKGKGAFENNPSGASGQVLYFGFSSTTSNALNYAGGFTGLSFGYSFSTNAAPNPAETVNIWSGLNGTGSLLDTLTLTASSSPIACTTQGDSYCSWSLASATFGTAESVTFGTSSSALSTEFDGIKLTASPVPLPAAAWLLLSGLGGLGAIARRRKAA